MRPYSKLRQCAAPVRMKASIIEPVDKRAALYQQFDPARPLEAHEEDLYVDWQRELGRDDIKQRLANSIALSGGVAVSRLFTGHRGVGKTTELKRVKRILEEGNASRKLFVSFLRAQEWLDLQDVKPPDIVLHIVRQLVDDLGAAGFTLARTRLAEFFKEFRDVLNAEVELKDIKIPAGVAEFGLTLKEVPVARAALRRLLEGHLPTLYHLINEEILKKAKGWLRDEGGYEDILLIVDELDRIPQKVINDQGLTNHENIFVDHAGVLRFLNCDTLYTVPIELAYSRCRERLKMAYASEILALPVIPVSQRNDSDFPDGIRALCRIVEERIRKAGATVEEFFSGRSLLERLCRLSGGHVRNLFILLRSCLERCDSLPITRDVIDRTIKRQANDISLPLGAKEWKVLQTVHQTKKQAEDDVELWYGLLRDLFVFAYEDDTGIWYDWNPLVGEVRPGGG
jgi:hypothetical protein